MKKNYYQNIIIGAGIGGLTLANKLKKAEEDFLLIESTHKVGGNWNSLKYKNSIYEFGPSSFMSSHQEILDLVEEIGFSDELLTSNFKDTNRYLYLRDKLIAVKPGPGILFSGLLSPGAIFRALSETFISSKSEDESVDEFFTRRFGKEVAQLVGAALQGVWAGDTGKLSIKAALPKLVELESEHGSIIKGLISKKLNSSRHSDSSRQREATAEKPLQTCSFKNGMASFCEAIAERLGDSLLLNAKTEILDYSDDKYQLKINGEDYSSSNLIIASKAFQGAELIRAINSELAEKLDKIYYAPVQLTAFSLSKDLFSEKSQKNLNAFGFISGKTEQLNLGTIWSSELFPERQLEDEFLMLSFAGGTKNPQITEQDLQEKILQEQIEVLSPWSERPLNLNDFNIVDSKIIEKAIPQYHQGHTELIKDIEHELRAQPRLYLTGNYLRGVSIADCIKCSSKVYTALQLSKAQSAHRNIKDISAHI